jgi:hypothetical protein
MTLAGGEKVAAVERLWMDGHDAIGIARQQTGGPPRDTGLTWQAIVDALVLHHDRTGEWAAADDLATDLDGISPRWLRRVAGRAPGPPGSKPYARVFAIAQERVHRRAMSSG